MDNEDVIRQLEDYIAVHKIRKYELARELNTTEANISRWLKGRHKVSKAWLEVMKSRGIIKET